MHEATTPAAVAGAISLSVVRDGAIHPICPVDLRPLPPIAVADAAAVRDAIDRARKAQSGWADRPFAERTDALRRAAKAMLGARAEVIALMRDEVGKLEVDALMSEVLGPLDQVSSWASVIGPAIKRRRVMLNPLNFPKKKAWIDRVPRGVIGIIAPWNYPVATLFRTVIPALLSGNGVVLKPSEYSTGVAQWFCGKLAAELPPGLLMVVPGGRDTGVALIEGDIDACIFTGSIAAGRDVSKRCGERMIPCSIELGGKDAALVLHDCDLDRTLAGITHWALHNVGQACGAIEIAYVDDRIADPLVQRLAIAWAQLKVGPGGPGEVDISPLANAKQLALVEAHVEDAIAKGAKLVCGGRRLDEKGLWYLPTILDHCTSAMDVVTDETFGPVLAIVRVDGAADAIRRINAGRYGLTSSIWTRDHARALRLAEQIDVGVVTINNHAMTGAIAALPWSGTRETGTGIANSELALGIFTRPKTVLLDSNEAPELFWMPYDRALWELGNLLSEAQIPKIGPSLVKIPFLIKRRVDTVRRFFQG
ncbi:MAG: aldehyde dehydrogenase family protein [Myxococcota bacterium]|nr:aldehyde dehydrogenase family protein [Myxococcota bacterium]